MGPSCSTHWPKRWRGGRRHPRIPAMWVLAVILLVALMIPIAAILVDSPLGRSVARRLEGDGSGGGGGSRAEGKALGSRLDVLGTELADLRRAVAGMHYELPFVQRLPEEAQRKQS